MKSEYFNKFIFIALFIVILISSSVLGAFDVEIDQIEKNIYPDEYAKFNISVTNYFEEQSNFAITTSYNWIYILEKQLTSLENNETSSTILLIKPKTLLRSGKSYSVPLIIKSSPEERTRSFYLPIYLKSYTENYGEYVPSLNLYSEYDDSVDPREGFKLKLKVRNRNALNITNMIIKVDGDLFYKELDESLLPLQEKNIQVNFDLNPIQESSMHNLNVEIIINNKTYVSLNEHYEIIKYSDIQISEEKARQFLRTTQKLSAVNNGNTKATKTIELKKNWIQRLFLSSDVDYDILISDGDSVIKWDLELEPQESTEINLSNNYRLLFIIIIVIAIIIYLYFTLRSAVIIKKRAKVLRSKAIEGVSKIKIKLFIKNRTSKKLHDVEIREKLSRLTNIVEDRESIGTTRPSKIIHGKKNTIVKWKFDYLEPNEERIITYRVKSKLKMVGSVILPRTIVKFKDSDGRIARTRSNKFNLVFNNSKK